MQNKQAQALRAHLEDIDSTIDRMNAGVKHRQQVREQIQGSIAEIEKACNHDWVLTRADQEVDGKVVKRIRRECGECGRIEYSLTVPDDAKDWAVAPR